ncbi:unnamed protein product [Cunninghamella blakesleeana]
MAEEQFNSSAQDEYYHNARERSIDEHMEEYLEKPPPPAKKKFYKNKKYLIPCGIITAILIVVIVCLVVFVFFPMICQSLMNQAGIDVNDASISFNNNQQSSSPTKRDVDIQKIFYMNMKGGLKNTGPFNAHIVFHNPIQVYYNDTLLGTITLPPTDIGGGKGSLDADTPFEIQDPSYFSAFSKDMLAFDNFDWTLKGSCDITALGRTAKVNLDKTIGIPGMGGFKDVKIQSFQLPANDPKGGIVLELGTLMKSPSPIGVQLGTIQLQIGYDGVNLGMVSAENVTLNKGDNSILLKGTLIPQNNTDALDKIGTMFSTYVSGGVAQTSATGVSAAPDGQTQIHWLTESFKSVILNVGLSNQGGPLNIIKAVNMGLLDMTFQSNDPYRPVLTAPTVVADFEIPFGFSLDIYQVTQTITMNTNQTGNFSEINIPWVPSQSNQQAGKLQFPIHQAALSVLPGKNDAFNDYTYDLTASDLYTFGVTGLATTKTSTPIGNITLGGIKFNLPTSLHGLQFLNSTPTTINSVDMTGGTKNALQLDIGVSMGNPSDITMSVGDVVFNMFSGSTQVGTVTLANLTLQRGNNNVIAKANFDPKSSQEGQTMLSTFVMGKNSSTAIGGFAESTAVASLAKALGAIKINTVLPGLSSPLIKSAGLTVLPDTIQTGIVNVAVVIGNPFTAGLAITKVVSAATYKGMPIGNINQDISNNPFVISGHANGTSPQLNMNMNLEPAVVALLMRDLAVDAHMDTKALDALLGMGGFHVKGQEDIAPTADVFKGFNISSYTIQAMKGLKSDLALQSTLQVGEYVDDLSFSQNSVPIISDDTVTRLIPVVGQPIVQQIVNAANLGFQTLILSDPTNTNAKVQMKGSITKTGPMDATIAFPTPLTIRWGGKVLGTATMPAIQAMADQGAQFDVPSNFIITDQNAMQEFAAYMINNKEFIWEILTDDVSVTALGFTFTKIKMQKFVTIKGCDGFKGAVTINGFDLPSNDPAGGITLITNTTIVNPSQVGFSLTSVGFVSYYKDVYIGPLAAAPAAFAPVAPSSIQMKGRMIPQNTQHGLDMVTEVFNNYLSAKDSVLIVKGDAASGPAGQVGWLTEAFKTLKIENVILPGPKEVPQLIPSITMMDMELDFTKDYYAPPTSSKATKATLKSPFGFPLGVSQLTMDATISYNGQSIATLKLPSVAATTSADNIVTTSFNNVPLKSIKNDEFNHYLKDLTSKANVTFGLAGTTNTIADTAVGRLHLNNIAFNVQSQLAGFNNFLGKNDIMNVKVVGGDSKALATTLQVGFTNPSAITINVGDMQFTTIMNEFNADIGIVSIKNAKIVPGYNKFDATMGLAGSNDKAISQMLSNFMTQAHVPLTILGSDSSTPITSLKEGFGTVKLDTAMDGYPRQLVKAVKVVLKPEDIITKVTKSYVTLYNPLNTDFVLSNLKSDVFFPGHHGDFQIGKINSIPTACIVPSGGTITCDAWDVVLTADLLQLGEVVLSKDKSLDLKQNVTTKVGGTSGFPGDFYYYQDKVPTEMDISLFGNNFPLGDQLNSTNSSNDNKSASSSSATPSTKETKPTIDLPLHTTTTTTVADTKPTPTKDSKSSSSTDNDSKESQTSSSSGSHFLFPFKI